MKAETKTAKRLLNPRRLQSLLKRTHEALLADSRHPMLTPQERLAYLKVGAETAKLLGMAEGQRRKDLRAMEKSRPVESKGTIFD